jgi:hypothetical protein
VASFRFRLLFVISLGIISLFRLALFSQALLRFAFFYFGFTPGVISLGVHMFLAHYVKTSKAKEKRCHTK